MNRKKFLASASVLAIASIKGSSALKASHSFKKIPLVDTHQHLADLVRFGKGWTSPPMPGNYDMKAYLEATRNVNMVKGIYMEVGVPVGRRQEEALYAIEICKDKTNPTRGAIISGDLKSPEFETYISQFKDSPIISNSNSLKVSGDLIHNRPLYSTVTDLAKFLGLSTSMPNSTPM